MSSIRARGFAGLIGLASLSVPCLVVQTGGAAAEPAPSPFRTIARSAEFESALAAGDPAAPRDIEVPDAEWLQIEFGDFDLGEAGTLTVEDLDGGETQTFTQSQLVEWAGLTAIFPSTHLRITLQPGPGEPERAFYEIGRIFVGEPPAEEMAQPAPGGEESPGAEKSQCGAVDDRAPSNDARVGRIAPIGCTGWIIGDNTFLTAGHCVDPRMRILEFSVPASNPDRSTNPALVRDQYAINQASIVSNDDGAGAIGDDWAVFRVAPNTQTGLLPRAAQGAAFALSNTLTPSQVTVVGYGTDTGASNQTQQTHGGAFLGVTVEAPNDAFMEYTVDTEGGNSGSPVFSATGGGEAVGIHTNAGCNPPSAGNVGTSFQNGRLWRTIGRFDGPFTLGTFSPGAGYAIPNGLWLPADLNGDGRTDIVHAVQNSDYVHTWMSNGDGTFAVGTFSPGAGYAIPNGLWLPMDINGDGRTDIVHAVQNSNYVHTWISNGNGAFTVGTFSPGAGYAIPNGLWLPADLNGDGRTDIVHAVQNSDYVHTWMSNGDGTFAVGAFSPGAGYAIPNGLWLPMDINGDGRTDIVHAVQNSNYVHTWISNGNGAFTVGTFSPGAGYAIPNGLWLPADLNGDGRTDIVHAVQNSDYVHTWMSNGNGTFTVGTFRPWAGYAIPNGLWLPMDINGDGRTDIVHAVQNSDYVHTWISNGNGAFTVGTFSPADGYAIPNGLWLPADLNGDGKSDIVHAVQNSNYVHTWLAR